MRPNARLRVVVLAMSLTGCVAGSEMPLQMDRHSGSVAINGVTIPYVEEGSGRPCLVLGGSILGPRTYSDGFKAVLRCVHVDHRGFVTEAPPPPGGPFTIDVAVDEFERVRRELGMDRFVLVGHSVHGLMALAYALRFPEHVSHVIAIGAPPAMNPHMTRRTAEYWDAHASPARKRAHDANRAALTPETLEALSASEAFVANYVANAAMYWADSTYNSGWLWDGVTLNMERITELFDPSRPYELLTIDPPLAVPVLVVLGRHDYVVPPVLWEEVRISFSDLTIELFEASGHTPQLEEAAAFERRLLAWLGRK